MAEIIETENSNKKGADFEILFAEFMKSDLKWDGYVIRSQQKGKSNSKGAQVDIIANRIDKRGKNLIILACSYLLLMIAAIGYGLSNDEELVAYFGIFTGLIAVVLAYKSRDMHRENAWVECKNLKRKADIDLIRISIDEYKDYVATNDKEYKFVKRYFVSANGFVENALKHAIDNGIECWVYKNEKFEQIISYWK